MKSKSVTMAPKDGNSPIGGMIKNAPLESDMDLGEAGEASCMTGQMSGTTTHVSFIVATEL
jgi:hypothetical protein